MPTCLVPMPKRLEAIGLFKFNAVTTICFLSLYSHHVLLLYFLFSFVGTKELDSCPLLTGTQVDYSCYFSIFNTFFSLPLSFFLFLVS